MEAGRFLDTNPYRFVGKFKRNAKDGYNYVFRVRFPPAPPRIGVLIGDVVHNLRSSLDHLVYQLVLANGRRPHDNTGFPIFLKCPPGGFRKHTVNDKLRGVDRRAAAEIGRLQPYRRRNGGRRNLIYTLHDLWNADKHRDVARTQASIGMLDVTNVRFKPNADAGESDGWKAHPMGAFKDNAPVVWLRIKPAGPNPHVEMDGPASLDIALEGGYLALPTLHSATMYVTSQIKTFERFF